MELLSLDRLVGPGASFSENFEILCLELIKAAGGDYKECYRLSPPDRGVDIVIAMANGITIAYQCKAYPRFTSGLLSELAGSIEKAIASQSEIRWDDYWLIIPFVPTAQQRQKLIKVLKQYRGHVGILDGDELEARLFNFPDIAARFFPSLKIVWPPQKNILVFQTKRSTEIVSTCLRSVRTGQLIPIEVSPDITCGGLVQFLKYALRLPDHVITKDTDDMVLSREEICWKLSLMRGGTKQDVAPEIEIGQLGIREDDCFIITYSLEIEIESGFMKSMGARKLALFSRLWEDESMGTDLIQGTGTQESLLSCYVDHHLKRVAEMLRSSG
ncbi:MAG: hypothetical protein ABSE89_11375 [Sedimentisphaerales bacterium]